MIDLPSRARELASAPKGILAADESVTSADKRLAAYGIATGVEMRRQYRELFLGADGIEAYLSGVILFEETLSQKSKSRKLFPKLLQSKGIMAGIKVDEGTEPFPESPDELITKGLLGLSERLARYVKDYGTSFTKWRAVIRIDGDRLPTASAILENAKRLASYACEVQRAGMVPILEPEVLLEGNHSRARCREVMKTVLSTIVDQLMEQCADPSAVIIKTSMVLSGDKTKKKDTPEEVASDTLGVLMETVPKEVGGIIFLSGGQSDDQATENLRAIAKLAKEQGAPWPLTFSYARALQDEALKAWEGKPGNVAQARKDFLARLKQVSEAAGG